MIDAPAATRAPLRALDWRFFLPLPRGGQFAHLVVLGGPPGIAARALELGLARRASTAPAAARCADAVVVLAPERPALEEAATWLTECGVLYLEVDRAGGGALRTPGRVGRALTRLGLLVSGLYAVGPTAAAPSFHIPLDVPGALRWYVRTVHRAATAGQWAAERAACAATGLWGERLAPFAPRFALTATAGEERPAAAIALAREALAAAEAAPRAAPGPRTPRRGWKVSDSARALVLGTGGDRVVVLPFAADGAVPEAVVKVPRAPEFNGRTENERAAIETVRALVDEATREAIPAPLALVHRVAGAGELSILAQPYLPGTLLSRTSGGWRAPRSGAIADLRAAAAWLSGFHRQTEVARPAWGEEQRTRWLDPLFAAFGESFGARDLEAQLFAATRRYADALPALPFPIVWQHRDFNLWNIAREGDRVAVLDWEGARIGPALCDALHLVMHWYETLCRPPTDTAALRAIAALFLAPRRSDPLHRAVHRVLVKYLAALEMDARLLPPLLVATWVELGLRRADQRRLQGELGTDARSGNRAFEFLALLASRTEVLFGADRAADAARAAGATA